MNSIAYDAVSGKDISSRIAHFFKRFKIGAILRQCNAYKEQGVPVLTVMMSLFQLVFRNRSMYLDMQTGGNNAFCKDTAYRFRNSIHFNWTRFTTLLASKVIREAIDPLTSEDRMSAFVVDDSLFERGRSSKVELLARVFDHAHHRYVKGFRMLTLGWSDGASFVPVNSCLLSTENADNRLVEANDVDKRSHGAWIRSLAQTKATDVLPELVAMAQEAGVGAKYILFDSWFTSPKMISAMKKLRLDTVAMVKKTDRVSFLFNGEKLSNKEIYKRAKKRRGRSKYLLSVLVDVCYEDAVIPARLVYVRNRNKKSDYLVLLSTDTALSEEEVIQLYGKRWDIEVFFKTCKSVLNLTGECRSLSYDAMCAQTAIVFTRYIFLAVAIREDKDDRSVGPLFCLVCDEIADITFSAAMEKLQLFLEKVFREFNDCGIEFRAVLVALRANLPADIAERLDFDRLLAALR